MKDERIRFQTRSEFQTELRRRVDAQLAALGRPRDGGWRIIGKTLVMFGAWALGYALVLGSASMVAGPLAWAPWLVGTIIVGFAIAGLGMGVQHDGGHKAFSDRAWLNRASGAVLDFVGGSSYVWRVKHGVVHHTYPNIEGADDDIELQPLARLAPSQKHYAFHRMQHIYLPILYGMIGVKWFFFDDYRELIRGRVGNSAIARPRGSELALFIGGKLVHLLWMIVVPVLVLGWAKGLLFYFVSQFIGGVTLSLVFQLAHCVEEAEFIPLDRLAPGQSIELDFARHQLATTVDFAPTNRFITWYVGGLNFQAIHHVFPRISSVHYAVIAPVVEQVCKEYGVRYRSTPSLLSAVRSHVRWLRRMGRGELIDAPFELPGQSRPALDQAA